MSKLLLAILFFLLSNPFFADTTLEGVYYLQPSYQWSELVDIHISKDIVKQISPAKPQKKAIKPLYVVPSFCDAFTTIGADSLGGQQDYSGVRSALKSFVVHGFTHILSVADGPWIHSIKKEIDSGKMIGPEIVIAPRPILTEASENKNISDKLYFKAKSKQDFLEEYQKQLDENQKHILVFHRFNGDSTYKLNSYTLNSLREISEPDRATLSVVTFGDRNSILDSLLSRVKYIYHPIPVDLEDSIKKEHLRTLHWSPMFNVFYLLKSNSEELAELFQYTAKRSSFFRNNYLPLWEAGSSKMLTSDKLPEAQKQYISFINFFVRNKTLKKNMVLSSGSGNLFAFPGVSGLWELKILEPILDSWEDLIKIPTENTCKYLGSSYSGTIREGLEANLLILKDNPLVSTDSFFRISSVYKKGKKLL